MLKLLTSNFPPLKQDGSSFPDIFYSNIERADAVNIASGFISVDALTELYRIVELNNKPIINLIIGMHYFSGFSKPQYKAACKLNELLINNRLGNIWLAVASQYHGKIYSFQNNSEVFESIIGSSNLSSITENKRIYETDVLINNSDFNRTVLNFLNELQSRYCKKIIDVSINAFNEANTLLEGHYRVEKLTEEELTRTLSEKTSVEFTIPLKASSGHQKSNLNVYFGKGRKNTKTHFIKPRHWYEIEVIVPKEITQNPQYPKAGYPARESTIHVITDDGWKFNCKISGDYSKNFRSEDDLKILGKWIKGRLENSGALETGELVTDDVLKKYGRNNFKLIKTNIPNTWFLDFGVRQ